MSDPSSPPRVLVTGANGFVGRELCATLARRGTRVIAGVRQANRIPAHASAVRMLGDLADTRDLRSRLDGIDLVVHLAGRAHVASAPAVDSEIAFARANARATARLAEAAAAAGVRRFLFLSSVKVHGETTARGQAFAERDTPAPRDAYGRSKLAAEQALWPIAARTGLEVVVIRPPLIYGPGVKANFLRLLRWVERGWPLPFGAIDNRRSLLGLGNLCDLIHCCLNHPAASGQTFLAADRDALSIPALIRAIAAASGTQARLPAVPAGWLRALAGIGGQTAMLSRLIDSLELDTSFVRARLGWQPPRTLDQSLPEVIAWYRGPEGPSGARRPAAGQPQRP